MSKAHSKPNSTLLGQIVDISEQIDSARKELSQLEACAQRLQGLQAKMSEVLVKRESRVDEILSSVAKLESINTAVSKLRVAEKSASSMILKVQMQMQHENQVLTSVSNVLKVRHDTVKNTIGNIR